MPILIVFLLLALTPQTGFAQGGPPMVTDDPDTPGEGHFEFNIVGLTATSIDKKVYQFPYFDLNYGLGDRVQLKLESGWELLQGTDTGTHRGISSALTGIKLRFLEQETSGISVSIYPQYEFHHFLTSSDPLLSDDGNHFLLPIEFSRRFGAYSINPEVGRGIVSGNNYDFWFYGLLVAYEFAKRYEVMGEIHGSARLGVTDTQLFYNFGARIELAKVLSLLLSAGHSTKEFPEDEPQLFGYFGVQLRL